MVDLKKRILILISVILFISSCIKTVIGEENLILDKEIYDGEIISVKNQTIGININQNYKVQVNHNKTFVIMNVGDCKTKFGLRYCLINVTEDENSNLLARLKFYELHADLDIQLTLSKNKVYVGEEININISIENKGTYDATNCLLIFPLGDNITALRYNNLILRANSLIWEGKINKKEIKEFIFTAIINKETKQKLMANISYNDGEHQIKLVSNEETIVSDDYFSATFSNSTTTVGNEITLYVNYSNQFDSEVFFRNLIVKIPQKLQVTYYSDGVDVGDNTFEIIDSVPSKNNYTVQFKLIPELSGNYTINVTIINLTYVGGSLKNIITSNSIKVNKAELELSDDILSDITVESKQTQKYTVFIKNPSVNTYFQNIVFRVFLDNLSVANQEFARIGANTQITVPLNFLFPEVSQTTTMKLNFSIVYESMYGEKLYGELTHNLKLNPYREIKVRKVISNQEFWFENKTKIDVYLKNEKSIDINSIEVEDVLSQGLLKVLGNNKKIISLDSNQETLVYSYEISAKSKNIEKIQNTTTIIKYGFDGKNYKIEEPSYFTVLGTVYLGGKNISGQEINISVAGDIDVNIDNLNKTQINSSNKNNLTEVLYINQDNTEKKEYIFLNLFYKKLTLIIIVLIIFLIMFGLFVMRKIKRNKTKSESQIQQPIQQLVGEQAKSQQQNLQQITQQEIQNKSEQANQQTDQNPRDLQGVNKAN
ncbi:MAG: hypothetical protein QXG00_06385 [Candidatus Woesearchaeota archaeon]